MIGLGSLQINEALVSYMDSWHASITRIHIIPPTLGPRLLLAQPRNTINVGNLSDASDALCSPTIPLTRYRFVIKTANTLVRLTAERY